MKQNLPTRRMREHPDLVQLKRQAKELLRGFMAGKVEAAAEVDAPNRAVDASKFALHEVAAMGDHVREGEAAEFVAALLDAGAKMDVRDDILRSTALSWACRWGRADVVAAMLEPGADLEETHARAMGSAWAWAEKMGHGGIVEMLSANGGKT